MIDQISVEKVRKYSVKSFYFRMYLLFNLPMGFLCGMRIRKLTEETCEVTVPYKWLNKNPLNQHFGQF